MEYAHSHLPKYKAISDAINQLYASIPHPHTKNLISKIQSQTHALYTSLTSSIQRLSNENQRILVKIEKQSQLVNTPRNLDTPKTQNAGSPNSMAQTARLFNRNNWQQRTVERKESAQEASDLDILSVSWSTWGEKGFNKLPSSTWEQSFKQLQYIALKTYKESTTEMGRLGSEIEQLNVRVASMAHSNASLEQELEATRSNRPSTGTISLLRSNRASTGTVGNDNDPMEMALNANTYDAQAISKDLDALEEQAGQKDVTQELMKIQERVRQNHAELLQLGGFSDYNTNDREMLQDIQETIDNLFRENDFDFSLQTDNVQTQEIIWLLNTALIEFTEYLAQKSQPVSPKDKSFAELIIQNADQYGIYSRPQVEKALQEKDIEITKLRDYTDQLQDEIEKIRGRRIITNTL